MYSVLNKLSEYTYFYISKNIFPLQINQTLLLGYNSLAAPFR